MGSQKDKRKKEREKRIFKFFLKASNLPVKLDSIESLDPPAPDILCQLENGESLAFELTELIDGALSRAVYEPLKLKNLFIEEYTKLPANLKNKLDNNLNNALIHTVFHDHAKSVNRKNITGDFFDFLSKLDPVFTGNKTSFNQPALTKAVDEIRISRGCYSGPIFDFDGVTSFGKPTLDSVKEKFRKNYEEKSPIELLIYTESQPQGPDSNYVQEIQNILRAELANSVFQRAWLFDAINKEINFVHSKST